MTKSKKMSNKLRQTWTTTNSSNWDSVQSILRSAKKMIDNGEFDSELIDTYLVISEAFKVEFGGRHEG